MLALRLLNGRESPFPSDKLPAGRCRRDGGGMVNRPVDPCIPGPDTLVVAGGRAERTLEDLTIRPPISAKVVALVSLAFVATLALGSAFLQVSEARVVTGSIVTSAPVVAVLPGRTGIIRALYVKEGSNVDAGARLIDLDIGPSRENAMYARGVVDGDYRAERAFANERVEQGNAAIALAAEKGISSRRSLSAQRKELLSRIESQRRLADAAREREESLQPFLSRGFIARNEVDRARQDTISTTQELSNLRSQLDALDGDIRAASQQEREAADQARVNMADAKSRLRTLDEEHWKDTTPQIFTVRASSNGVVTAIQYRVGQYVDARHPALFVVPDEEPLEADLIVPDQSGGLLRVGQIMNVETDAYPASEFGYLKGEVLWVSRSAIQPQDLAMAYEGKGPAFLVRLRLLRTNISKRMSIRSGMRIKAQIVVKRTSLLRLLLPQGDDNDD